MGTTASERCFAATSPGLEGVLREEASALGRATEVPGGVELSGPRGLHQEASLHLRVANRVLLRLASLRTGNPREAALDLAAADLSPVAAPGAPLWLESTVRLAGAPRDAALRTWLGRVWDRPVRAATGEDRGSPGTRLVLRLVPGEGTLSADASGELLYRRGWRQEVGRAPMRETLAAGMLALAGWRPEEPLWDPMCGSGTLLVEAALRARRMAPGLARPFAFERWPGTDLAAWAHRREAAARSVVAASPAAIHGSDLNAGALGTARRNARRAGVLDSVVLERADVGTVAPVPGPPGLLLANLPYGRRAGSRSGLDALYQSVGQALRTRFLGWRAALFAADPERLARAVGRRPEAVHRLDNGGIQVALSLFAPLER